MFGLRLDEIKRERGINYKELALLLDTHYHNVRRWCVYGQTPQNIESTIKNLTEEEKYFIRTGLKFGELVYVLDVPKNAKDFQIKVNLV